MNTTISNEATILALRAALKAMLPFAQSRLEDMHESMGDKCYEGQPGFIEWWEGNNAFETASGLVEFTASATPSKPNALAGVMLCCPDCGNPVSRDAWANWNPKLGQWELGGEYDMMTCTGCGDEMHTADEVPLDTWVKNYPDVAAENNITP